MSHKEIHKEIHITERDGLVVVECVDVELSALSGEPELVPLVEGLGLLELAKVDLLQAHGAIPGPGDEDV